MTIKKIALSALAATMATSIAFAGTLSNSNGTPKTISSELLSIDDVNISNAVSNVLYVPSDINLGSLKNPVFNFTFSGSKALVPTSAAIYEAEDGNESNASNVNMIKVATFSNKTATALTFAAINGDIFVHNGRKYVMLSDDNTTDPIISADINVTVAKAAMGTAGDVTMIAELGSGDTNVVNDTSNSVVIATVEQEYSGNVLKEFDARIDASEQFSKFFDKYDDNDTVKRMDRFQSTVTDKAVDYPLEPNNIVFTTTWDNNLTKIATSQSDDYNGSAPTGAIADFNLTATTTNVTLDLNGTGIYDLNLTTAAVAGTSKIDKTYFTHDAVVVKGTSKFPVITSGTSVDNAGKWTVYGYYAQIPEVQSNASKETYMTIVNTTSLSANAYFTILPDSVDADGTVNNAGVSECVVDAGMISANQSHKFTFSNLLTLAANACDNFPTSGNFAVEIAVPTTPDGVYAKATQKNTVLNQFKDLPVYNTSEINY